MLHRGEAKKTKKAAGEGEKRGDAGKRKASASMYAPGGGRKGTGNPKEQRSREAKA